MIVIRTVKASSLLVLATRTTLQALSTQTPESVASNVHTRKPVPSLSNFRTVSILSAVAQAQAEFQTAFLPAQTM